MGNGKPGQLGPLQLAILKVLWDRGPGGVAEVNKGLGRGSRLAYTTVATVLRRMEADGLVAHETDGRRFIYRAAVPPEQVVGGMADDLVDRVFEGSLADMVSHLLSTRDVDADELARLEQLIAKRKKQS
ncbi:MAG TPA: BlaI/MecI/CopY family transcriptional regulator [Phycisphaerae bacterium]|nr:BlaI/MecI/CopY family transcriptional regulator [Phycisphaerae bacterium]